MSGYVHYQGGGGYSVGYLVPIHPVPGGGLQCVLRTSRPSIPYPHLPPPVPQSPESLLVLCEGGLFAYSLNEKQLCTLHVPHPLDLHSAPVTCLHVVSNVSDEIISSMMSLQSKEEVEGKAVGKVGGEERRGKGRERRGGERSGSEGRGVGVEEWGGRGTV